MYNITEQQLFNRIVTIRTEIETLTLDLKQLKADATYHKDHNPGGIDKADVKVIDKAAEANRISMAHVEARRTQADTFKERLEAVKNGTWKASRVKLKIRGGK